MSGPVDPREPRRLRGALDRLIGELELEETRTGVRLREVWAEALGEDLAAHAQPGPLRDGVLTVSVADAAWATQVRYLADRIAHSLNECIGEHVVRQVRVAVDRP